MQTINNIDITSVEASSSIKTTGILPSYYDSAPNIVVTETTTLKMAPSATKPTAEIIINTPKQKKPQINPPSND
jgi:hypothetical protein